MDELTTVLPLEQLPDIVFEQVLMMLSYHEIAQYRRVNKRFNRSCMALLNKGFRAAERYHTKCLKVLIELIYFKQMANYHTRVNHIHDLKI